MSNIDGEDTLTKIIDTFYKNRPESRRVYSSVLISEIAKSFASKELASIREQLAKQEEVIRELIPIAEEYRTNLVFGPLRKDKREKTTGIKSIIEKAKSLTTKDK